MASHSLTHVTHSFIHFLSSTGTPGYIAPEAIKGRFYGPSVDIFSFGVIIYRMLAGSKPFRGKGERELDRAVVEKKVTFPKEIFSTHAVSLLSGLLVKNPAKRLGCGPRGIQEIKEHPFFGSIDWGLLEAGYLDAPFIPNVCCNRNPACLLACSSAHSVEFVGDRNWM